MVLYDFAIIGGDLRQVFLAELLSRKGYRVVGYGLDISEYKQKLNIRMADTLKEAICSARKVLGPIPLTKDQVGISGKVKKEDLTLDHLKEYLDETKSFYAGSIPKEILEFGAANQVAMCDFMKNEELAVFNSIATAEGAIGEALVRHPVNLHKSSCLILGFGKCGVTLAHKLNGMSAKVTICVRKRGIHALADAYGYQCMTFQELGESLGRFDYIFNTVPKLVLDRELLSCVNSQCLIIDIASAPGGVDFEAAKELGINAHLCLGLPGRYAPKSSAKALLKMVLNES